MRSKDVTCERIQSKQFFDSYSGSKSANSSIDNRPVISGCVNCVRTKSMKEKRRGTHNKWNTGSFAPDSEVYVVEAINFIFVAVVVCVFFSLLTWFAHDIISLCMDLCVYPQSEYNTILFASQLPRKSLSFSLSLCLYLFLNGDGFNAGYIRKRTLFHKFYNLKKRISRFRRHTNQTIDDVNK